MDDRNVGTVRTATLASLVIIVGSVIGCRSDDRPPPPPPVKVMAPPAGASLPAKEVELQATSFQFTPGEITAAPGQKVKITLVNKATSSHSLGIRLPGGEKELDKPIPPGASGILEIIAPDQPGTYIIYCPLGSHEDRGMRGKFIVKNP